MPFSPRVVATLISPNVILPLVVFLCNRPVAADVPAPWAAVASTRPGTPIAASKVPAGSVETVVIFRHGEKPEGGLGQLGPQGLNRALALSTVLPEKFGKPDALFAPDPRQKVTDHGDLYCYIRPLATIEPTAIRLGMPVETPCGYRDTAELIAELTKPQYASATLFVAWEHAYARSLAVDLLKRFGADPSKVPNWSNRDYDSLYVVKVRRADGKTTASFTLDHEGLDNLSATMPAAAQK